MDKDVSKKRICRLLSAGSFKVLERNYKPVASTAPWIGVVPTMDVLEERGGRMLSKTRWKRKCFPCYYASMANVEIIWDFDKDIKRNRFESFFMDPNHVIIMIQIQPGQFPTRT